MPKKGERYKVMKRVVEIFLQLLLALKLERWVM